MFARCRHYETLVERRMMRMVEQFHHHSFTPMSSLGENGSISVFQVGGGFHRDSRGREYIFRRGHVVSITRPKDED